MPTALQFRRGTTSQNNSFTGAVGEVSVDTTLDTLVVHDGSTAGGFQIVNTTAAQTLTNKTLTTPTIAEIDSGSTITLDATTDITLDAGGADIFLKDDGTLFGTLTASGGQLVIKSSSSGTTAATFSGANVTLAGTVASGAITSSGSVTGTQGIFTNASPLVFEGSTADSYETTIAVTDPTADRTWTIPNSTDTFVGKATTDTLTNKTLTTPVIATLTASGDFTVDATTDINLDADGGDIFFKDGGTTFGSATNTGGNLIIKSGTTTALTFSGANVTVAGNLTVSGSTTTVDSSTVNLQTGFVFEGATDNSFETTMTATDPTADRTITLPDTTGTISLIAATETLTNKTLTTPIIAEIDSGSTITLDAATDIVLDAAGNNITLKTGGTTAMDFVLNGATDTTLDAPGDIKIDAGGGDIFFVDDGTTFGSATNSSGNLIIKSGTTTAATFSGANVTLAGTVGSGAITSTSTVTSTGLVTTGSLVYEGSTADSFETTLGVVDPTADRSVNVANAAGTLQPFATASTTQITATVAEVNLMDGGSSVGTTAVADGDGIVTNDGGTMKQTTVQTFATYFGSEITAMSNLVTTGALNSGSITSGFGSINIGSSTFTTTGAVGTGAVTLAAGGTTTAGSILFKEGTDNGTNAVTLIGPASTADVTLTLPSATDTLVGKATTDTLTNKTLTAPTITAPTITGNFSLVFEGSSADSFETTIGVIDPTADRAVNIANAAGTLIPFAAASTTQISSTPEELNKLDGATVTTAEINLIDGGTARGTDAVASGDGLLVNDGGTMKMTNVDTVSTYFASHSVGGGNIVTTGALNSGSITSGFGNINTGSSTITTTGAVSVGELTTTDIIVSEDGTIIFEGATNNSFETTLTITDPTADRTVTLPNETFKVASYANKATLDGNGSTTTITVGAGYDVDQFLVTINGVMQEATEDYSYSSTTLTMGTAPASGERVVVRY
jgi:hypothetical protein